MKDLSKKRIAELQEKFKKSAYKKNIWTIDDDETFTLEEAAEYLDPALKFAEKAYIIVKEKKNGDLFLKMEIALKGGNALEYELSYDKDSIAGFEEDDQIDLSTVKFCVEKSLDKEHFFATGEII